MPSDASMEPSRRNLSKTTIFDVCAPHVLEENEFETRLRVCYLACHTAFSNTQTQFFNRH